MARTPYWLRERLKLFIQYLAVFVVSLPVGFLYFLLLRSGISQPLALLFMLPIGLLAAYVTWGYLDKKLIFPDYAQRLASTSTANYYEIPGERRLVGGFAVAIFMFHVT